MFTPASDSDLPLINGLRRLEFNPSRNTPLPLLDLRHPSAVLEEWCRERGAPGCYLRLYPGVYTQVGFPDTIKAVCLEVRLKAPAQSHRTECLSFAATTGEDTRPDRISLYQPSIPPNLHETRTFIAEWTESLPCTREMWEAAHLLLQDFDICQGSVTLEYKSRSRWISLVLEWYWMAWEDIAFLLEERKVLDRISTCLRSAAW
jgi:hypothetical protein